jgi:predicted DNA-binding protein
MIKYAINSKEKNDILIFHALPNEITKFQWYISEKINERGNAIEGQTCESYVISTEIIKEKNYYGKYLYCEYLNNKLNVYEKTEYIPLEVSLDSMINKGVIFDDISEFDEKGYIINVSNKLEIAKELLKNTKNFYVKNFIEEYITNFNKIQDKSNTLGELDLLEYRIFDRCIEYIEQSKFDINGWGLLKISYSVNYAFFNENRKESFDLFLDDRDIIIPTYIGEANSIKEAIEKYI